jgi:hypothetical protein
MEPTVSLIACDISGDSHFAPSKTQVRRPESQRRGANDQEEYL